MIKTRMQKGITLIALIITIIILLILAVVTIGSIKKSNIITYAQNASTDYGKAKNDEEDIISDYKSMIKENLPGESGSLKIGKAEVGKIVNKNSTINGEPYNHNNPIIPAGFAPINITIEEQEAVWNAEDGPEVENGLVIQDEAGNQFVWVPVADINTMVMCKTKTASDQCSIELNEENTQLVCETHNGSTDICGKLYGNVGNKNIHPEATNQTYTNFNRQPYNLLEETNTTYQSEFNEMALSIAKNGGFYVGRYEVSFSDTKKAQSKGSTVEPYVYSAINSTDSSNNNNAKDWYGLYELCKTYNTSSVKSSMIWGSQYDAMLIWMGNDATNFNTNNSNLDVNLRTGFVLTDVIRNVYDLGGNCLEWTYEATKDYMRVFRGCYDYGTDLSPSGRFVRIY